MEMGIRVVRGRDWKWGNQDSGEGHVGSIVEIGQAGSTATPDKTVVVQWDSGSRTNYRVGYQGAYDLRIYDNAPIGVKHPNIICDTCKKHGIKGMRWKCTKCFDYDLCTVCYMSDKHDISHSFMRYDTSASVGVPMATRQDSSKSQAKGIFVGAKVVRGADWDWGLQDGGEGKIGRVLDIRGWDSESGRSVANVMWASGATNVYRLGHKGKVDLRYTEDAVGGFYYRDHLPILGQQAEQVVASSSVQYQRFNVGDRVTCSLVMETLKAMQEGHGGWNPRMAEHIGRIGTVHRVTERGDIRVQYEGCNNRWTFHPGALTKVDMFAIGDIVRVCDDIHKVRELQKNHGEWTDNMKSALGKAGKVLKIYLDGDLRVAVATHTWTFNPACVTAVPGSVHEINNTMQGNDETQLHTNPLATLLATLNSGEQRPHEGKDQDLLVREAAQGHLEAVTAFVDSSPDKVDVKSSGKTALQVAAHQGHLEIVLYLLLRKSNLEIQDDDGDTALHYSAFGNQPGVMEELLQHGAKINTLNRGRCSALHVAVNKQHVHCVKVLLKHKCSVNIQDSYGDTALHDAIGKDSSDVIDLLINGPSVDFSLRNKRGFNVLHHGSLKGNNYAVEKLLQKTRQIVDVKKDDGFAALHLAALNGHTQVADTLLTQGGCDINICNNRKQTPLLLAVSQMHAAIVELLAEHGANVDAEDEDADRAVHLALSRSATVDAVLENSPRLSTIMSELEVRGLCQNIGLAMACYLAQKGSNLAHRNKERKCPLDYVNVQLAEVIKYYASLSLLESAPCPSSATMATDTLPPEDILLCMICDEPRHLVTFKPCEHRVACDECCIRMKRCMTCQSPIATKLDTGGQVVVAAAAAAGQRNITERQIEELVSRMQEMEEHIVCSICMERKRNIAFLCGHGACQPCALTLKTCHMCRERITKRINLY